MKTCLECGKELKTRRRYAYTTTFCAATCRRVFNNRRATRGATLYDLYMISHHNPDAAARTVAIGLMAKLRLKWEKEDGQRRRYKPTRVTFDDLSYLTSERLP